MKLTVGTDPEVFLFDTRREMYVSAYGLFPGTKAEPHPLKNGHVQVDGHALEFNTRPASDEDSFVEGIFRLTEEILGLVKDVSKDLKVRFEPVARFDPEYFHMLPLPSKVLGCDPDFSAVTGRELSAPDIMNEPIRTSSGHIHVGWTEGKDPYDPVTFMNAITVSRGISPTLLKLASSWETPESSVRRMYYGREMSFRPKPYGVELRSLDSLWLLDEVRIRRIYRVIEKSLPKCKIVG